MVTDLIECRWGKIRMFVGEVHTDSGRTQVVHELSSGDEHPVQDRGLRIRRTRVKIQFDDFPGQLSPVDAALALERAKNTGQTAIFQHPLLGRYLASIGEYNSTIDESSVVSAEAEFIQEAPDIAVTPTGAASSGTSGEASVTAAASTLDNALAKTGQLKMSAATLTAIASPLAGGPTLLASIANARGTLDLTVATASALATGIASSAQAAADSLSAEASTIIGTPSTVGFAFGGAQASLTALGLSAADAARQLAQRVPSQPGNASVTLATAASAEASTGNFAATTIDARVSIAAWNNGDVPTRQIMIDAARISNNIAVMIDVGGLELDLALWPAFKAAIMLGDAVRDAAIAATSDTPAVFTMRVVERTALLPLAARIYGGAQAQDRAAQIATLNDIPTPAWLPPGDYLLPVRPAPAPF
jgi:cell division septum initiation protein DivIVA